MFAKIISIVIVSILSSIILFDRLRIYDYIINLILIYILFFKKIKNIFIKQNIWITLISIVIGLPLGYLLVEYLFKVAIEEHYDFSAYITTYIVSLRLAKRINKIDMVSSLKSNE